MKLYSIALHVSHTSATCWWRWCLVRESEEPSRHNFWLHPVFGRDSLFLPLLESLNLSVKRLIYYSSEVLKRDAKDNRVFSIRRDRDRLPATFDSFSSCFLDTGQKHIPYTMGPALENMNTLLSVESHVAQCREGLTNEQCIQPGADRMPNH